MKKKKVFEILNYWEKSWKKKPLAILMTFNCCKTFGQSNSRNRMPQNRNFTAKKLNVQYVILLLNAVYELNASFFICQLILTI